MNPPTRRDFVALTSSAAALGIPRWLRDGPRSKAGPWIPSDAFLAELPRLMDLVALPGVSIAVLDQNVVRWKRFFGLANMATKAPLTAESTFEAASMSKPVFAYLVMRLADERVLDLDRPLVGYRRPGYLAEHPWVDLITARDVLRHSTGLPNWRITPDQKLTPKFEPGTAWGYSGEGYFWLQLVVEQLTGVSFDRVARSRLFDPAGMTHATFGWDAYQAEHAVSGSRGPGDDAGSVPFQVDRELGSLLLEVAAARGRPLSSFTYEDLVGVLSEARSLPKASSWPENIAKAPVSYFELPVNTLINAAGSLKTTPEEYAKFMALMMPGRRKAAWEIGEPARVAMLTPQKSVTAGNDRYTWGFGWALERRAGWPRLFEHGGNNGQVYRTFGVGDMDSGRAIVVFTNGGAGNEIAAMVVRDATGLDPIQFL